MMLNVIGSWCNKLAKKNTYFDLLNIGYGLLHLTFKVRCVLCSIEKFD